MKTSISALALLAIPLWTLNVSAMADEANGIIDLVDSNEDSCQLIANGNGSTHLIFNCNAAAHSLRVVKLPSTATVTLSKKDCSEETTDQDWWVRIEATARNTASEKISVVNIARQAKQYLTDPSANPYVAPNLRITGGAVKNVGTSDTARCAIVRLPTTAATRSSQINVQFSPERYGDMINQGCGTDALAIQYFGGNAQDYFRNYHQQCMRLTDAEGNAFVAYEHHKKWFDPSAEPTYCGAGEIVTGMNTDSSGTVPYPSYIECAKVRNSKTHEPLKIGPSRTGRWVEARGHFLMCETPDTGAPTQLVWSRSVITGWDRDGDRGHRPMCADYSAK